MPATSSLKGRMDAASVLRSLDEACGELAPGELFPSHREWMKRLDASERAVRWALDELQRQGKVVRRHGAGTFVAHPQSGNGMLGIQSTLAATDAKTVVAIAAPDRSIFDHAMGLLFSHVESRELSLVCRLVNPTSPTFPMPRPGSQAPLGYIVFRRDMVPIARQLQAAGHRVVLVGAPEQGAEAGVPNVYGAHETGGCAVTRHLLEQGHRRIAFHGDGDLQHQQRWQGYLRAMAEAGKKGVVVEPTVISMAQVTSWRADLNLARRVFEGPRAPTAVVAWNDHEAMLLLNLLTHIGLRVPQDISLVGYDNLPQGALMQPALTTVDSAIENQLEAALEILAAPAAMAPTHTVIVLPTLIVRDSTAAVRSK